MVEKSDCGNLTAVRRKIKIYGERNSNTRYLSELLRLNLEAEEVRGVAPRFVRLAQSMAPGKNSVIDFYFSISYQTNLGWKHTCVKPAAELADNALVKAGLVFLTVTKNPYSWLLSLHRRPYHNKANEDEPVDFETFLKTPWPTLGRDDTAPVIDNPVVLWNIKNRSYLGLPEQQTLHTRTEDYFEDPAAIIEKISETFSIPRRTPDFANYERSTKDQSRDSAYYRDYYLNERWREKLSSSAIKLINQSLDKELVRHFDYRVLA